MILNLRPTHLLVFVLLLQKYFVISSSISCFNLCFFLCFSLPLASLKRTLSSSPSPAQDNDSQGLAMTSTAMDNISCPHLNDLKPPRPDQIVHREECTQCFDSQVRPHPKEVDSRRFPICLSVRMLTCVGRSKRR